MTDKPHTHAKHVCPECGAPVTPRAYQEKFCSTKCRKSFNNRRMTRGAAIYDLFMVMRHERGLAKLIGAWSFMCRLAMYWKEQDDRDRDGRRSWRDPRQTIEQNSWAHAMVVDRRQKWKT